MSVFNPDSPFWPWLNRVTVFGFIAAVIFGTAKQPDWSEVKELLAIAIPSLGFLAGTDFWKKKHSQGA